jgi:23S rRNA (uracil1939-C5)-methyltransferase
LRLTIEKLVYGGDGLARLESDSAAGDARRKPVFVPFVLEGEQVEAALAEDKGSFARARLASVVVPSPNRATPPCQHFARCGGCQYQHATYAHQLEAKAVILRETLARTARLELACELQVHSAEPLHYRNRARLQLRSAPFALGYFRAATNDLLPVEHCPISSPLLNRALAALWQLGRAGQMPGGGEVELFANAEDNALLLELHNPVSRAAAWKKSSARAFAELLHSRLPELRGVVLFPAAELAPTAVTNAPRLPARYGKAPRRPAAAETAEPPAPIPVWGEASLDYRVAARAYRVPAGAFFQGNRHLLPQLVTAVTSGAPGHVAFDLYAGVGLFAVALAERFERVTAVEVAPESYSGLQQNVPPHVQTTRQTTEAFLKDVRFRHALRHADFIVVDPPRAGLGERVTRALVELQPRRIAYVSCDPATLARDLVTLLAAGYDVEQAHLFDLFPQTAHLETVLHLTRPQEPRP